MNVNDSIQTSLPAAGKSGTKAPPTNSQPADDDVHLSELVKSLRALAAASPERQAKLEELARTYANGSYTVDAGATASKIIDDSLE